MAPNIKIRKEKSSIFQRNKKIDILNKLDENIISSFYYSPIKIWSRIHNTWLLIRNLEMAQ